MWLAQVEGLDLLLFELPVHDLSWNLVAADTVVGSSEEEELATQTVSAFRKATTSTTNTKSQARSATIKKVGPGPGPCGS